MVQGTVKGSRERRLASGWIRPIAILIGLSLLLFWGLYATDHVLSPGAPSSAWARYLDFDPRSVTDAFSSMAAAVAAVLGIVITVVSIVVQLSAARFAGITRMFLRDPTNVWVVVYYVVVCVAGLWLSVAIKEDYVPRVALVSMLLLSTGAMVLMVPYFGYVFTFLEPQNIIRRIQDGALAATAKGARSEVKETAAGMQAQALVAMEELTDIASASISNKDKIIASGAVDALKDLALDYLVGKREAQTPWFLVHEKIAKNPDFVAMDPESLVDLEGRRTWFEWKIMRQYLGIYNEALGSMRDINYLIAIDTRYLGEASAKQRDDELSRLVYRFMNSYLRATLNARDVRTAYNVLNQYRLLVESMLRQGRGTLALEGVRHMIYYGHVSFDMKLPFVTETVAYDVSSLCETAHELGFTEEAQMVDSFLELDRPLRVQSQEGALIGVRKAQVKLGAYYLSLGLEAKARRIANDMKDEPVARLEAIFDSLFHITTKDFWEIIDRGRNFEFMPGAMRARLPEFFAWLGVVRSGADVS